MMATDDVRGMCERVNRVAETWTWQYPGEKEPRVEMDEEAVNLELSILADALADAGEQTLADDLRLLVERGCLPRSVDDNGQVRWVYCLPSSVGKPLSRRTGLERVAIRESGRIHPHLPAPNGSYANAVLHAACALAYVPARDKRLVVDEYMERR